VAKTIEQTEAALGAQVKRARIEQGLSQNMLADLSNVSLATVQNLERGSGSSLATLIKVVRVLKKEAWLEQLAPDHGPSPMQLLRASRGAAPRLRVRRAGMIEVRRRAK